MDFEFFMQSVWCQFYIATAWQLNFKAEVVLYGIYRSIAFNSIAKDILLYPSFMCKVK
jgi:hypothetical protein